MALRLYHLGLIKMTPHFLRVFIIRRMQTRPSGRRCYAPTLSMKNVHVLSRFAQVTIITKQGKHYKSAATEARGDPEKPLTDSETHDKFHQMADGHIGVQTATTIESAVAELGAKNSLDNLLALVTTSIKPH